MRLATLAGLLSTRREVAEPPGLGVLAPGFPPRLQSISDLSAAPNGSLPGYSELQAFTCTPGNDLIPVRSGILIIQSQAVARLDVGVTCFTLPVLRLE